MTETSKQHADPIPLLLIVLSGVTGLVDAISILGMGRVFTANMTGNVVFLGFAVGGAPGFEPLRYVIALAAFLAGAWLGGRIGNAFAASPRRNWLIWVAVIEAGLFWAAALTAIGYDFDKLVPTWRLETLIALTAVAMGLRNATVRMLKIPDMTTTVLTLTLTGLAADSNLAGGNNANWQRRIASVLAILAGAALGAALIVKLGLVVPLVLTGVVVIAVTVAYAMHPASREPVATPKP